MKNTHDLATLTFLGQTIPHVAFSVFFIIFAVLFAIISVQAGKVVWHAVVIAFLFGLMAPAAFPSFLKEIPTLAAKHSTQPVVYIGAVVLLVLSIILTIRDRRGSGGME